MSNNEHAEEKFFGTLLEFIVSNKTHLKGEAATYVNKYESALLNMVAKTKDGNLDSGHAAELHKILNGAGLPLREGVKDIVQAHKDGKTIANADQLSAVNGKLGIGTDPSVVAGWWASQVTPAPTQTSAPTATDPKNALKEAIGTDIAEGFEDLFAGLGEIMEPLKGALGSVKGMWDGLSPTLKAGGLSLLGAMLAIPLLAQIPILGKPLSGLFSSLMPIAGIVLAVMFLGNILGNEQKMQVGSAGHGGQDRIPGGDDTVPAASVKQERVPEEPAVSMS